MRPLLWLTRRIVAVRLIALPSCLAMASDASHTDVRAQPTALCPYSARDLSLVRGRNLRADGEGRTTDVLVKPAPSDLGRLRS